VQPFKGAKCGQSGSDLPALLLEQAIERRARIARVARSRSSSIFASLTDPARRQCIASNCHARREKLTRIGLILQGDAHSYWLDALEPGRGLEIHALLATVQSCVAFRAFTFEVDIRS
jgi:hypothetical protein